MANRTCQLSLKWSVPKFSKIVSIISVSDNFIYEKIISDKASCTRKCPLIDRTYACPERALSDEFSAYISQKASLSPLPSIMNPTAPRNDISK